MSVSRSGAANFSPDSDNAACVVWWDTNSRATPANKRMQLTSRPEAGRIPRCRVFI